MRRPRREGLAEAIAARRDDPAFRRALADLRETCAFVIDPRYADRDVARLVERYAQVRVNSPISPRFEAVLHLLPCSDQGSSPLGEGREGVGREPRPPSLERPIDESSHALLAEGLRILLAERLALSTANVLDPWAGDGTLIAAIDAERRFANVADPALYARASAHLEWEFDGLCLADSLRLPPRTPTPGFDFSEDENNARVSRQQMTAFPAIASDLRGTRQLERRIRWMADRLAPQGVVAFLSDGVFVDEPSDAELRAWMESTFAHVAHIALGDRAALTFMVRGDAKKAILYAHDWPASFAETDWTELQPTEKHVWRTEILRPEWPTFLPLATERGAIFGEAALAMPAGTDTPTQETKAAKRILRNPFAPAWRVVDRKARREPIPPNGPRIIVLREPYGVFVSGVPIDGAFGGRRATATSVGGRVSAATMRRFRSAYGAAVAEGDVFDYAVALLHHPDYRTRFYEDLRRGVPRLPLVILDTLPDADEAPPVGPGTAFGTGWLRPEGFEPGTLPDYDDPFASPYARGDVEPGFLLMVGLGAALARIQTEIERLIPYPLVTQGGPEPIMRPRPSADGTRAMLAPGWTLEAIPTAASTWRIGSKSALEWALEATKPVRDFDPVRPDNPDHPTRLVGQVVAASLEVARLTSILEGVPLSPSAAR